MGGKFGLKIFWIKETGKKNVGQKFLVKEIFRSKKVWVKITFWDQKNFVSKKSLFGGLYLPTNPYTSQQTPSLGSEFL